ncbi:MAG: hypothetical protein HIU92_00025 [Proteobacteria bacterium]|nr:hypothetical protein [Pseudomonadota bacterium]
MRSSLFAAVAAVTLGLSGVALAGTPVNSNYHLAQDGGNNVVLPSQRPVYLAGVNNEALPSQRPVYLAGVNNEALPSQRPIYLAGVNNEVLPGQRPSYLA